MQAELERKREEEAAAAAAAAAAEAAALEAAMAADPVLRLRAFAGKHSPREIAAEVKALDVDGGPAGRMLVAFKALFAGDTEQKLAVQLASNKAVLRLLGTDAAGQMSQLIALEYLLAEAIPDRIKEVQALFSGYHTSPIMAYAFLVAVFSVICFFNFLLAQCIQLPKNVACLFHSRMHVCLLSQLATT